MNDWSSHAFSDTPLMAIFGGLSTVRTLELAHSAWDAGITCVEIPIQSAATPEEGA